MPLGSSKPENYEARFAKHLDVSRPNGIRIIDEDFWQKSAELQETATRHCLTPPLNLAKYLGLGLNRMDLHALHRLVCDFEESNLPFGMLLALGAVLTSNGVDVEIKFEHKKIIQAEELTDEVKRLLIAMIEDMTSTVGAQEEVIDSAYLCNILGSDKVIVTVADHNYLGRYADLEETIYRYLTVIGYKDDVFAVHDAQYWWGRREMDKQGDNIRFIKSEDLLEALSIGPSGEKYIIIPPKRK